MKDMRDDIKEMGNMAKVLTSFGIPDIGSRLLRLLVAIEIMERALKEECICKMPDVTYCHPCDTLKKAGLME